MSNPARKDVVTKDDYFDITRLFKVMDANGWTEAKRYMKFWAEGKASTARVDPAKKKSTIGANVGQNLRIYTIPWDWLIKFHSASSKYQEFFKLRLKNPAVVNLIKFKYGRKLLGNKISMPFNEWLIDGLEPHAYLRYIKEHQLQYIHVNPYKMNGEKFNDLVGAVNGFNFFAFYKGNIIDAKAYRANKACLKKAEKEKKTNGSAPVKKKSPPCIAAPLSASPVKQRRNIEAHLNDASVSKVIEITHVGIYAGDIYEFNGKQYLATWDIVNNTVELSNWDYFVGTSDTDDDEDLAITNETFRIYRKKTGKGGDFLALSSVQLVEYPIVIPVS